MNFCVVNSTDLNPIYAYFMPIVNRIWSRYMEYCPVALLYGSEELWRSTKINSFLLDEIKTTSGNQIHFVKPVTGYRSSSVMQVARASVGALLMQPDDYMIISDVDMIPMSKSYFRQQDGTKKFHIFSADAYTDITKGWEPLKFPMCYLGASSQYWREIFGITTYDISFETAKSLEGRADCWDNVEAYVCGKIKASKYYKSGMQLMVRTWPCSRAYNRLDRESWHFNGQAGLIDAHFFRPGYDHLGELLAICKVYFKNDVDFVQSYTDRFKRNL